MPPNIWASGASYEPYVGRWSRLTAREFVRWLNLPSGLSWLDVGCGSGALTQAVLDAALPQAVQSVDASADYLAYARQRINDPRAAFQVADAQSLPWQAGQFDAAVSGLVLNFVPQPAKMVSEMSRVTKPGGTAALYLWDYAGEIQLIRYFWDAAVALDPAARALDEGVRFPICQPEPMRRLFSTAGLQAVEVRSIDVPTVFRGFDDFWSPFLSAQGPAPAYAMSLSEEKRAALREYIRARLPFSPDGSIHLIARAWAVRGLTPG